MARYTLVRADAFEWLAGRRPKSVHAVVTDPPFGNVEYRPDQLLKRASGKGGIWRLPQQFDGHTRSPLPRFTVLTELDHAEIAEFHAALAPLLLRVLVPGGHVFVASQNLVTHLVIAAFSAAGFELRGQVARVVKTFRGGDRPKDAHEIHADLSVTPRVSWEPWLLFRRPCEGRVRDNLARWGTGALRRPDVASPFRDLILSGRPSIAERKMAPHPSLKPQEFMRKLVRASLPLGKGVIIDPFMGAGATIAAAEHEGLRSIGVEIREDFFAMAERAVPLLAKSDSTNPQRARQKTRTR